MQKVDWHNLLQTLTMLAAGIALYFMGAHDVAVAAIGAALGIARPSGPPVAALGRDLSIEAPLPAAKP